uniref:Ig-like domain-containing protein n=1 Tax=Pundamilia nyererei TaxID=303518 RepID=A0A3B4G6M4_9CICH
MRTPFLAPYLHSPWKYNANSYPSVSSFTWMKMIDGMMESTISTGTPFIVDSASVSDSGKYRCTATNKIGTGKSVQVEVKACVTSLFLFSFLGYNFSFPLCIVISPHKYTNLSFYHRCKTVGEVYMDK